jgi:hypothetical protein
MTMKGTTTMTNLTRKRIEELRDALREAVSFALLTEDGIGDLATVCTLALEALDAREGKPVAWRQSEGAGNLVQPLYARPVPVDPVAVEAGLGERLRSLVIIDEVNSNNTLGKEAASALASLQSQVEALTMERDGARATVECYSGEQAIVRAELKAAEAEVTRLRAEKEAMLDDVFPYVYALLGADNKFEAAAIWERNPDARRAAYAAVIRARKEPNNV